MRLHVNDASGAGMEAPGTLESLAAGISRKFETDSQGIHTNGYETKVELPGRDAFQVM
jgi:hypothetical protein